MSETEMYPCADYAAAAVDEAVDAAASEEPAPELVVKNEWPPSPVQPLVRVPEPAERPCLVEKASARRWLVDRMLPLPFLAAFFWPWALVVIAYDLGRDAQGASVGNRRRLANVLLDHGTRVQKSAFECDLATNARLRALVTNARRCASTRRRTPCACIGCAPPAGTRRWRWAWTMPGPSCRRSIV